MNLSLRGRLMLFLIPSVVLVMVLSVVAQYAISVTRAGQTFDQALTDAAVALSQELQVERGVLKFELTEATARLLRSDSVDDIFFAVRDSRGELIAGDEGLPAANAVIGTDRNAVYDDQVYGQTVRVAVVNTPCTEGKCRVQVAETHNKRNALRDDILLGTVFPQVIVGGLAIALIWLGVGQSLVPLRRLSRIIDSRSSRDLGPIKEDAAPDEAQSLLKALNALFERLRQSESAQQRFISTAAHQLRTPLAGLKAVSDLTLLAPNSQDIAAQLVQINEAATRASRLANQLLALARAEHLRYWVETASRVNLKGLVEQHIDEWVHMANAKNIDIGFNLHDAWIYGKAVLLREMLQNILHNAVEYSPTGASVTVNTGETGSTAYVEVEDSGPGIPVEYREKVFEPFFRLPDSAGVGSGLGLAIALDVAVAHEAAIELTNRQHGRGTIVRVQFPTIDVDVVGFVAEEANIAC